MKSRLPDFMIVGEARCGSTSLWKLLAKNPNIYFPMEKELHFFGTYDKFGPCGRCHTGDLDKYKTQFTAATEDQVCGEATPNYLSDPNSLSRIRETLGIIKCIVILREPVARAYSHYWQSVNRGWESFSFEEALEKEQSRIKFIVPNGFHDYSYFTRGLYAPNIERMFSLFDEKNCLVLFLEELKNDQIKVQNCLTKFLNIKNDFGSIADTVPTEHVNKFDYPKSPALYRFQLRVEKTIDKIWPGGKFYYKRLGRMTRRYRTSESAATMNKKTEQMLCDKYFPYNKELSHLVDRKLPWPKKF